MRFLRPSAGSAALCVGALLLACSPDKIGGPAAPEAVALGAGEVAALTAPAVPKLVITEIMADPSRVTDANGEWFEIYNACPAPVNLNGYRLNSGPASSQNNHTIVGDLSVPGNGFVVLGVNRTVGTNGGVAVDYVFPSSFTLNNSNTDWVAIRMPDGTLVDEVHYVDSLITPRPSYSPPAGASRVLVDITKDNRIIAGNANWATSATTYGAGDRGTPGSSASPYGTLPDCGGDDEVGPVASVAVAPASAQVVVGRTKTFTASAADAAGTPVTTAFAWTSSNPGVVTVEPTTGVATGIAEGTAQVTATAPNGVGGSAEVTVTLTPGVASIVITTGDGVSLQGYTRPLFTTTKDADGTTVFPALTWRSLDESRATVDGRGYVTFRAPGAVTIEAKAPNGVADSITLTALDLRDPPADLVYNDHLEFGTPTDATPADEFLVTKRQFVSSWNAARGGPNWVSWSIDSTNFGGSGRCNCFTADETLPSSFYRVHDWDYRNSGYDRGHMVQSDSRSRNFTENAPTFLMTNILPQAGENNQGPWQAFENFLNAQAETSGREVFVVAGGIYGPNAPTLKDSGKVAIPDYTWKVAVVLPRDAGRASVTSPASLQVYAVKMPNLTTPGVPASAVGIRNNPWQMYETTVDAIEAETGYDVFALLPDHVETLVESIKTRFPVPTAGGPYATVEGGAVTFTGSATDPDGDALTYAWDLDADGTFESAGATASRTFADDGAFPVSFRATDAHGAASVATVTVTVANANPVATLALENATVTSGQLARMTGTFTDAGASDDPWAWTLDWGFGSDQGSLDAIAQVLRTPRACAAGTYAVRFAVTDEDGGADDATATLTVVRQAISIALPAVINAKRDEVEGKVAVTVLTDGGFDATKLDPATVRLGAASVADRGDGDLMAAAEDADGDGDLDLVLHFERDGVVAGTAGPRATLALLGALTDGCTEVAGSATVRVLR